MIFGVKSISLTLEVSKKARELFLKSLNKRFSEIEINRNITSAALLDPRVKDSFYSKAEYRTIVTKRLLKELEDVYNSIIWLILVKYK